MGHCQGYEILQVITSQDDQILESFDAENIALSFFSLPSDFSHTSSNFFSYLGH